MAMLLLPFRAAVAPLPIPHMPPPPNPRLLAPLLVVVNGGVGVAAVTDAVGVGTPPPCLSPTPNAPTVGTPSAVNAEDAEEADDPVPLWCPDAC